MMFDRTKNKSEFTGFSHASVVRACEIVNQRFWGHQVSILGGDGDDDDSAPCASEVYGCLADEWTCRDRRGWRMGAAGSRLAAPDRFRPEWARRVGCPYARTVTVILLPAA